MKLTMRSAKDIRKDLQETKREMRAKGIRRISFMNGGLSGEVYSLNARCFALETELETSAKREAAELSRGTD